MDDWTPGMGSPEVPVNAKFNALVWALTYAVRAATTSGLFWGYYGGPWSGFTISEGVLDLSDDATNYIVVERSSGVISVDDASTNWDDLTDYARVYRVVTVAGFVTEIKDFRAGYGGVMGAIDTVAAEIPNVFVNSQTGTTYTYDTTDKGKIVTHSNGSSIAATLPEPGVDFPNGWWVVVRNSGVGVLTITSTSSTIDSAATLALTTGQAVTLYSNGSDYVTNPGRVTTNPTQCIAIACGDEVTPITEGIAKVTFRMPYAFVLTAVRGSLTQPQDDGDLLTVDINESGASILSTKLTFDNTFETTVGATTPVVISDSALADDAPITIDVDLVGDGLATGLKIYLIGQKA